MSRAHGGARFAGVTKQYGDFVAVGELSFEVPRGVIYGILGPNGAGKTTTLRMINDIIAPDEGEIALLGELKPGRDGGPADRLPARGARALPQDEGGRPAGVLWPSCAALAAGEATRAGPAPGSRGWIWPTGASTRSRICPRACSRRSSSPPRSSTSPSCSSSTSRGAGLDPINADVLRDVVLEQREAGKTILFSTHLMEQAEQICDEVCIIARGKKVLDGELERDQARRRPAIGWSRWSSPTTRRPRQGRGRGAGRSGAGRRHARAARLPGGRAGRRGRRRRSSSPRWSAQGAGLRRFEIVVPHLHQIFVDRVGGQSTREPT